MTVNARLHDSLRTIDINQEITFVNNGDQNLNVIYLNDWNNAFSSKSSALAKRFAEDFARRFHFAKDQERGWTQVNAIKNSEGEDFIWERPGGYVDLIRLRLEEPLMPGDSLKIKLDYNLRIPDDKFTRYGVDGNFNYKLRYWYITPAPYDGKWKIYSHKDLGLQYVKPYEIKLNLTVPTEYYAASGLNLTETNSKTKFKTLTFEGAERVESKMYITKDYIFESIAANGVQIVTNVEDEGVQYDVKKAFLERSMKYLEERLGPYPFKNLFITEEDYLKDPIYGLNMLPSFIRPFPDGFQYDAKLFKTLSSAYLKNTIWLDPRKEKWVTDGIAISLMMDYVDEFYPNMKLAGSLSNIIGLRWFHAADLNYNDQYQLMYMNTARLNIDQPLNSSQDSLVKFNKNISNAYKAGVGIKYLEDFLDQESVRKSIKQFYTDYNLKPVREANFEAILKQNASKDIDWFFEDYVESNKKIDFKIQSTERINDSMLAVKIKNRRDNKMPISLYGIDQEKIKYKYWFENIQDTQTVVVKGKGIERLALNYEQIIPEVNQRNNYKGVTKLLDKPIQFRLLQDIEDPKYHQVFFMPEFDYNLYDGISIGPKLYNKTLLNRNFNFAISPKYGFTSETLVGSASVSNVHQFDKKLYAIAYGIGGTRFSYGYDLFYEKVTPFLSFNFRNPYLRSNEGQRLLIRNVYVKRDQNPEVPLEQPNYNVFNVRYNYFNPNFLKHFSAGVDYQLSDKFSKISFSANYRRLFKNNRQIELRMFAGTFVYSDVRSDDYFSFALDRPTDYLFDYNYYGRSQGSGLFSQQFIEAEGGFKSKLQPEYANDWIMTLNGSVSIWNWIHAYGDVGMVKNRGENGKFVYDSGIRVSLVQDYFELFFPVYSNLGWEIADDNYDQKIRFIVALDLNTLIKLFTRRWY